MTKKTFLIITLFFCIFINNAQEIYRRDKNFVDTATFMIWLSPNFSVQAPFGTGYLSSTFRTDYNLGVDLLLKSRTNWTFDFAFNYMFGSKLRLQPHEFLGEMVTDSGIIFNGAGNNSVKLTYEGRYWYFGASIGKIIPLDRWKNSGLWIKAGFGYFGHKIYFTDPNNYFTQLDQKTYRKGYDQRSSAFAMSQFFGYLFMHRKRVLSFYAGVELWEIFSKPDRGYIFVGQYAGPTADLKTKFSGLIGIKVGWIIPFYEKQRVTNFYTY